MIHRSVKSYALLVLLCMHEIVHAHGFSARVRVRMKHTIPHYYYCMERLHTTTGRIATAVASYDTDAHVVCTVPVITSRCYQTNCYMRLCCGSDFPEEIICTPTQGFYLSELQEWVPACQLKCGDRIWCAGGNDVPIISSEFIEKPYTVYAIEVKATHTYFVGLHELLTHNMILPELVVGLSIPWGAVAGGTVGAFFGPATLALGLALGGATSWVVKKCIYDHATQHKIVFDVEKLSAYRKRPGAQGSGGQLQQNYTYPMPCPTPPHEPEDSKKRNTDKVGNIYEFFEKYEVGRRLRAASEPTKFAYKKHSKIFRAIRDVVEYGIKEGDWFYLDKFHGDHIEVFVSSGKRARSVLNLDGSLNTSKFHTALSEARNIKGWIT